MKNILALLFSVPFFASAQDTCGLKKTTDPFTHQTKISTGFVSFVNSGQQLSISVDATSTDIDFFLWFTSGSKCFDDQSAIQIVFEGDRMKSNYRNTGSMNCEGAFHFTFKNTPSTNSNLQRLIDKKVNALHLTGPNKTVTDIAFSAEQKLKLQQMVNCVVSQGKALIKQ